MKRQRRFWSTIILNLCNFRRERKPGWLQNAETLLSGTRDLFPLTSTCRCSRTNEWNSFFTGSISDPLTQASSSRPSGSCPKMWKVECSSPMMILKQKQLSLWPTGECATTVERMVLTRSSRKRRQSLRNSFCRKLLFISSRDDNRRVPSRKCSSSLARKHEWCGSMYASRFSMTGKSLLHLTFCSRQCTNRESSPNPRYP